MWVSRAVILDAVRALEAESDATTEPEPDAELIRRCHQFAEAEFDRWYR
jgi:hypothetical protein